MVFCKLPFKYENPISSTFVALLFQSSNIVGAFTFAFDVVLLHASIVSWLLFSQLWCPGKSRYQPGSTTCSCSLVQGPAVLCLCCCMRICIELLPTAWQHLELCQRLCLTCGFGGSALAQCGCMQHHVCARSFMFADLACSSLDVELRTVTLSMRTVTPPCADHAFCLHVFMDVPVTERDCCRWLAINAAASGIAYS